MKKIDSPFSAMLLLEVGDFFRRMFKFAEAICHFLYRLVKHKNCI